MLSELDHATLSVLSLVLHHCQRYSSALKESQTHLRTKHHMCWPQIPLSRPSRCTSNFLAVYITSLKTLQLQRIQCFEAACYWIYM